MGACASSATATQAITGPGEQPCEDYNVAAKQHSSPAHHEKQRSNNIVVAITGLDDCGKHSLAAAMASIAKLPLDRKVHHHSAECTSFSGPVTLSGIDGLLHVVKVPRGHSLPDGVDAIVHCLDGTEEHPFDGLYSVVDDLAHEPDALKAAGPTPHSGRSMSLGLTPTMSTMSNVSSMDMSASMDDMAAYLPYIMGAGGAKTGMPAMPATAGAPAPAPACAPAPAAAPHTGGAGAGAGAGGVLPPAIPAPTSAVRGAVPVRLPDTPRSCITETDDETDDDNDDKIQDSIAHEHGAAGAESCLSGAGARGSLANKAWAGYSRRSSSGTYERRQRSSIVMPSSMQVQLCDESGANLEARKFGRQLTTSSPTAATWAGPHGYARKMSGTHSNTAVAAATTESLAGPPRYARKLSTSSTCSAGPAQPRRCRKLSTPSSLVTPTSILLECGADAGAGARGAGRGRSRAVSCPVAANAAQPDPSSKMTPVFRQAESMDSYFAQRRAKLRVFTGYQARKLGSLPEDDAPIIAIAVTKTDRLSKFERSYVRSQARSWGSANRCSVTMTSAATNYGCMETLTDVLRQVAVRRSAADLPNFARRPPTF